MCGGCGARGGILPGALTARRRAKERLSQPKVKGHSSNGVVKSERRKLRETGKAEVIKEMQEAAKSA